MTAKENEDYGNQNNYHQASFQKLQDAENVEDVAAAVSDTFSGSALRSRIASANPSSTALLAFIQVSASISLESLARLRLVLSS